ncbi:23 kDa integral membrane protein [Rhipicephalus sanguineus]|uniref:23 kDa integral membrane protein n=1 Tax=Rhipicephalus sanguineus TaxID=34632 RepID=UPI001895C561|nr:23 kDa integral membrane protein [Rhipicephalus sanguineus]
MAAKWVTGDKRKDLKPTRASVLCSKHFRDSDDVQSPSLMQSLGLTINITCGANKWALLVTFNLVFWLSGLALMGLGAFLLMDEQRSTLLPLFRAQPVQYLLIALVGCGVLVLLVGFFGCCGAVKESKCLLGAYLAFLFLVLACELAIGILALIFQHKILSDMKDNMTESLKKDYGKKTHVTTAFDWAQAKMLCCGVHGPADYAESVWKAESIGRGDNVSKTCCRLRDEPDAHKNPRPLNETLCQNGDDRHSRGCLAGLEELAKREGTLLVAVACGVAALQIIGISVSICLCKQM